MTSIALHGFTVPCPAGMDEVKFAQIMNEDMSEVHQYLRNSEGLPAAYLHMIEVEWKKYLVAAYLNKGVQLGLTKAVDLFAHTHMLFSKKFRTFCLNVMNGWLDHTPTKSEEERLALIPQFKEVTLPVLTSLFGAENVPSDIWAPEDAICWDPCRYTAEEKTA